MGGSVLVVDDELGARESMQRILKDHFSVSTVDSGMKAIELVKEKDFDVVLLDIRMPDISGIEVLERIKGKDPSPEVAMVTAHAALDTAKRAIKLGAYDYIEKPFTFEELREVVRKGVERRANASKALQLAREFDEIRQQLIQLEKLSSLGQMTSEVVHELAGPITGVIGYSELLLTQECDEIIKASLKKINAEAKRCQEIIRNFLAFARRADSEKKPININDVIMKSLDLKMHQLRLDNINIVTDLDPNLPVTYANFNQIQQVVINIINNAHYAMKDQEGERLLTITTGYDLDNIRVSISDTGPGIPPDKLDLIFEPFFTTKKAGNGTGLGLNISRNIIHEHNGRILVDSKEGGGTTFTIELPLILEETI